MIPKGWEEKKLEQVAEFENGKAHENVVSENGKYILVTSKFVSTEGEEFRRSDLQLSPLVADQIVMVMSDIPNGKALAKCFYIKKSNTYTLNQRICALTIKNDCSKYVYYVLNRNKYYLDFDNGVGQTNLRKQEVLDCPILIPPLNEQEKIAKILSTWDEAIEKIKRLVVLREKNKLKIASKILSGEMRLGGFKQKWTKKKLNELGKCIRGLTYTPENVAESGLLVLRSSNVQNGRISFHDNVYVNLDVDNEYLSKKGDILVCVRNGSRNLIGKSALIPKDIPKATHGAFMSVFRTKYSSYVFQLFQTQMYYAQVSKNLGATINSINNSDLLEFAFPFPEDEEEIQAIVSILEGFDTEISFLYALTTSYQKQKQGLMQQLLTGRKRVKA